MGMEGRAGMKRKLTSQHRRFREPVHSLLALPVLHRIRYCMQPHLHIYRMIEKISSMTISNMLGIWKDLRQSRSFFIGKVLRDGHEGL